MKEKILEKSNELFLNIGFKSVTMDEIASALGVSKKTIYKYFSNKTALVGSVTEYMFDTICCNINTICEDKGNPIEEMFQIKRVVMNYLKDEKSSPFYQLQKYYPKIYVSLTQKQFQVMQKTVQDNLQRGKNSGFFRAEIDIDFISRIYFSGMTGIKDQHLFPLTKYSMSTLMNNFLEYHIRGIATTKGLQELEHQLNNNKL